VSVHKIRMAGIVAALGAVAVLGATTFANGPAITDAGSANTKTAGIKVFLSGSLLVASTL
jgi:ABC-type molybdate transport system substrate-binding protein